MIFNEKVKRTQLSKMQQGDSKGHPLLSLVAGLNTIPADAV